MSGNNDGFYNAHNISIVDLFNIFYNRITYKEKEKIFRNALYLVQENSEL